MTDQAATLPDQSAANSGAFVKAFLPGLIIGLVLGGLAGAFLGGIAADTNSPAAMIERSKREAATAPLPPPGTIPADREGAPEVPAKPEQQPAPGSTPAPAPVPEPKPETKPVAPPH